jgi:hypothetical protein
VAHLCGEEGGDAVRVVAFERCVYTEDVGGSNPSSPIINIYCYLTAISASFIGSFLPG